MKDLWDKFWESRNRPLTDMERRAFRNNYFVFCAFISSLKWKKKITTLEIGCGRGTISDYFRDAGCETWTMDRISRIENTHRFFYGDVLSRTWSIDLKFDIIVSYGLLEHFDENDQIRIINNCDKYLSSVGMQIHYVVPRKLTNMFESREIYRDPCNMLQAAFTPIWVYPIMGNKWITNKFWGKGFVISLEKSYENIGSGDSKITVH